MTDYELELQNRRAEVERAERARLVKRIRRRAGSYLNTRCKITDVDRARAKEASDIADLIEFLWADMEETA